MRRYDYSGGLAFVFVVTFIAAVLAVVSMWTDRNLEFWLSYFKGSPVDVAWYISFGLTVVFNGVAVAANLLGEILRLIV